MRIFFSLYGLVALLIFLTNPVYSFSPNEDYSSKPEQHFRYHHLEGELEVENDPITINGAITYRMSAYLDGYDEIRMNAIGLNVQSVELNGTSLEYETRDEQLIIQLQQPAVRDEKFDLDIVYSAEPGFGIHRTARGSVWTSTLPATNRHWLPGMDHPRALLTTDLTFVVDQDYRAVTGGVLDDTQTRGGNRYMSWRSEDQLPKSELGFAVGKFQETDALFGIRRIRVFSEEEVFETGEMDEVLQSGHNRLRRAESQIGHSFPYDEFSLVMIEDDSWEPRSFAAGIGWIFQGRGELEDQIFPTLYAQWYGIYRQTEKWKDASALLGYQSWIGYQFGDNPVPETQSFSGLQDYPETVYTQFSADSLNRYREWFTRHEEAPYTITLKESGNQLINERRRVYSWSDFSDIWYRHSGLVWDDAPELPYIAPEDTLEFVVDVAFSASAGRVTFDFDPVDHATDRSVPATVKLYTNDGTMTEDIDIPGRGGEVRVELEQQVQAARVVEGRHEPILVDANKSLSMWLYQLRNSEDASARKKASIALREFDDDPDLQLALQDVIRNESDNEVLAEMYRTLGVLAKGSSGTQNTFLEGLRHSDRQVQMASLDALSYYTDDSRVANEVFEIISLSEDVEKVYKAVSVYRQLNPAEEFVDFLDRFLEEDEPYLEFTPGLIDELFRTDSLDFAVQRTEKYLEDRFPFKIRHKVWNHLSEHDGDADAWRTRIETYIDDLDPRMRMLAISEMHRFDDEQIGSWLSDRSAYEFDARVYARIDEILDDL